MTMPTSGSDVSAIDVSSQEGGGVDGPRAHVLSIVANGRDVTHLSPGRTSLPYMWMRTPGSCAMQCR